MSFAHLHIHTSFSTLDGLATPSAIVKRAKELGQPGVAITDHGNMHGIVEFYTAARKAGVKPIIGMEGYMAARGMRDRNAELDRRSYHITLLAMDQTGYQNLIQLASLAQLDGFYYFPRIDKDALKKHSDGLIVTSGCVRGEIPSYILNGDNPEAMRIIAWYLDVFGKDRFYLEIQDHNIPELQVVTPQIIQMAQKFGVNLVATNDVHYLDQGGARLQDVLLAVNTAKHVDAPDRMRITDDTYHMRSTEEMQKLFGHVPGATENTVKILEMCNVEIPMGEYHLPHFETPPEVSTGPYLMGLVLSGAKKRYGDRAEASEVQDAIKHEIRIIASMGFVSYFLIVWDMVQYAKKNGIWYDARGSASGSVVAYCLEITQVDPLEHGLIFERFLNPDRVSMPDIDLDFEDARREELIDYTVHKYGADKVAQIITFGRIGAKSGLRDVSRAYGIPLAIVNEASKMIDAHFPMGVDTLAQAVQEIPDLKALVEKTDRMEEVVEIADGLQGAVRQVGVHAAGVVISDKPITNYLPLHRQPRGNNNNEEALPVTQLEMADLETMGMLKVDFLGLRTLTVMRYACEMIAERHGVEMDFESIPTDDPRAYELIAAGKTSGVFQIEGAGMTRFLVDMRPDKLEHIIAMAALYRPGPLEFIPDYILRMHGEQDVSYLHPLLEEVFGETYGLPVYQEQVMLAAVRMANYTQGEADALRKVIAKKQADKLAFHRQKFIEGCASNGIDAEIAGQIFTDWENFARYGFNKAHAAIYGSIAVKTAFLKAVYPLEYMTALMASLEKDTDRLALYITESQEIGIEVLPPSVNASMASFAIEGEAIRFGLAAIKNVGVNVANSIVAARGDGAFQSLGEFVAKVPSPGKRALEGLIKAGALSMWGNKVSLLDAVPRMQKAAKKAPPPGQGQLFADTECQEVEVTEFNESPDALAWEKESLGLFLSGHPIQKLRKKIADQDIIPVDSLAENGKTRVKILGILVGIRRITTSRGDPMAFGELEDETGKISLVIFPNVYAGQEFALGDQWIVTGKREDKGDKIQVIANHFEPIE